MDRFSMGVPLEYKCERCGQMLHGGSGGTLFGGAEVLGHMFKKAKQCPACGKIFCGNCSIEVDNQIGRPQGAEDYTCPFCRRSGI